VGGVTGLTPTTIADGVLDALTADHADAGSIGLAIGTAGAGVAPSAATVADAVLDELMAGHVVAGSLAAALTNIDTNTTAPVIGGGEGDESAIIDAKTALLTQNGSNGILTVASTLGFRRDAKFWLSSSLVAGVQLEVAEVMSTTQLSLTVS
jgi:hypothetical protein